MWQVDCPHSEELVMHIVQVLEVPYTGAEFILGTLGHTAPITSTSNSRDLSGSWISRRS